MRHRHVLKYYSYINLNSCTTRALLSMGKANGQGHWTYCNPIVGQTLLTVTVTMPFCFRTVRVYCEPDCHRQKVQFCPDGLCCRLQNKTLTQLITQWSDVDVEPKFSGVNKTNGLSGFLKINSVNLTTLCCDFVVHNIIYRFCVVMH